MKNDRSYLFANERDDGEDRLTALAELYDDQTVRLIEACGPRPGWTCLEIGAGAGSIARYLSHRVAPGRVVATDIDTSRLDGLARDGIDVWQHDINTDSLPDQAFDFVHARLVLMHLPDPQPALATMVRTLKPGGWLLVEEFDVRGGSDGGADRCGPASPRTNLAARTAMERGGIDLQFGRRLPWLFREHRLADVGGEGRLSVWTGQSAGARLMRTNYATLRSPILSNRLVTADQFDKDLADLEDAAFMTVSPTMWSVWGRVPADNRTPRTDPAAQDS